MQATSPGSDGARQHLRSSWGVSRHERHGLNIGGQSDSIGRLSRRPVKMRRKNLGRPGGDASVSLIDSSFPSAHL